MPEILELEGDIVVVWKCPRVCKEQSLWRTVCALEQLVGEQASFLQRDGQDLGVFQEDRKYPSGIGRSNQASLDAMELFVQGECFLRTQEMGKPEGQKRRRVC